MNQSLLSLRDLSVSYQTGDGDIIAADKISFDIHKKEIFALVGESGCGKSTTALAIMRLIFSPGRISNGKIVFEGRDLLQLSDKQMAGVRGKEIGMIFQNPLDSLNPVRSVGGQIREALCIDRMPRVEAWKKTADILRSVRIADANDRAASYPFELSGGMRQRVMIGMMLSRQPKLLIADEPTTALDVTIQAQILELLKDLRENLNTSILVITHDFGIVAEIADRIAVMYAGKIVEIGDVYQIFERPLHPYTRLLMKALPRITKKEGSLETIPGTVPNLMNPPRGCRFCSRCPKAMDKCRTMEPRITESETGHLTACHLEMTPNA